MLDEAPLHTGCRNEMDNKDDNVGTRNKSYHNLFKVCAPSLHIRRHRVPGVESTPTPIHTSTMRNVITPMGLAWSSPASKPTVREAQSPSGNGKVQEANATSRKAEGIHNLVDRAS